MAKPYANIEPAFDTWAGLIQKVNYVLTDMGTVVVTVDSTTNGALTSGNAYVNGYFTSNNVSVISGIRGGTSATPADLVLTSNLITSYSINVGNSTVNNSSNSTVINIGNATVYTTINSTAFSGTANNANNFGGLSLATVQAQITGNAATAYTNAAAKADTAYANTLSKIATAYINAIAYTDLQLGTAYTNAIVYSANASNINAGTLDTARLPSIVNVSSQINVGANLYINTSSISISNSTVGFIINANGISGNAISSNVVSFNGRAGAITLYANDISSALSYTPLSANATGTIAGSLTLTSGDLTVRDVLSSRDIRAGNSVSNTVANSLGIQVSGNTTVYTTINSTAFSGIANNSTNFGGLSLSQVQGNAVSNAAAAYTNAASKADQAYSNAVTNAAFVAGQAYSNAVTNAAFVASQAYTNAVTISSNGSNISTGTIATARLGSGTANSTTILYGNNVWGVAPDSTNASALTSGTISPARLGSGTADSTTILYGNNVWASVGAIGTNTAAQFTWTNTHTHQANVTITGNSTAILTVGNSTVNATVNSTVITIGNTTVNSVFSAANTVLYTPTIRGSRETVFANTNAAGAMVLDLSYGVHRWTVTGNVTSLNFTNVPANNTVYNGTLYVMANSAGTNATNRAITFPSTANASTGKTLWAGGLAPPQTSSNSSVDIYSFFTIDGGNNYVWSLAVKDAK